MTTFIYVLRARLSSSYHNNSIFVTKYLLKSPGYQTEIGAGFYGSVWFDTALGSIAFEFHVSFNITSSHLQVLYEKSNFFSQ